MSCKVLLSYRYISHNVYNDYTTGTDNLFIKVEVVVINYNIVDCY